MSLVAAPADVLPADDLPADDLPANDLAADRSGQSPEEIAAVVRGFLEAHPESAVLEDGKVAFELASAQHSLQTEHGRCTLHLWDGQRQMVRTVTGAKARGRSLRVTTQRFGHAQTKSLEIVAEGQRRTPAAREPARKAYLRLLERVLTREFPDWRAEGFRAAMDLERSFGPAYARGSLVRGKEAWAVIGVGAAETQAIIDGVLTLGILWLHHCRERGDGRLVYRGLRVVVPRRTGTLTQARLPWMNPAAAAWEMFELEEGTEEITACDPADQGNLRTRLVHLPDSGAARERFAPAIAQVMALVPEGEEHRVEQRLRSPTQLSFLLHGFEFARARVALVPGSFGSRMEITAGNGPSTTVVEAGTVAEVKLHLAELFERRNAQAVQAGPRLRPASPTRSIGTFTGRPAHARVASGVHGESGWLQRRERGRMAQTDPLFRAAPERWLESVLRENLAPLTRSLAPPAQERTRPQTDSFANEPDPDTRGNRAEAPSNAVPYATGTYGANGERLIPRFDPRFVYTQVPAIAGASDRGMLDLLGMTADGRLAVIELKAADDLHLALQGLDYWVRVRHHHAAASDFGTGTAAESSGLQRHGYFRGVSLSPLPPRLYLVAPALHVHPATETILRYLSPAVEWSLLALDERWRQEVRVIWKKSGGRGPAAL